MVFGLVGGVGGCNFEEGWKKEGKGSGSVGEEVAKRDGGEEAQRVSGGIGRVLGVRGVSGAGGVGEWGLNDYIDGKIVKCCFPGNLQEVGLEF